MPLTLATVQQIAPDQASLQAANGLLRQNKWPVLKRDRARDLVWGECQGSGSSPYRVCAGLDDLGHKCTCPSRKHPCKHCLALLWIAADREAWLTEGEPPDWVEDWLSRRRPRAASARAETGPMDKNIAALSGDEPPVEQDPKRAAAAAKASEKRRLERESAVLAGLDDLETWVADALGEGLATFPNRAVERCRKIAARLVDAKAGALATRLDELPGILYALPEENRIPWLFGELGRITLLMKAYRRQAHLPTPLQEDVRRQLGWVYSREDLLSHPSAVRASATWTVLGVRAVPRADHLIRHETWLRRHDPVGPRWALLLDFVPRAGGAAPPWRAGEVFFAEVVWFPSATPLRALVAQRREATGDARPETALGGAAAGLDEALAEVQSAWSRNPWLDHAPVLVHEARLVSVGDRMGVATADGAFLALVGADTARHVALAASGPATLAGVLEPGGLFALAAANDRGLWFP